MHAVFVVQPVLWQQPLWRAFLDGHPWCMLQLGKILKDGLLQPLQLIALVLALKALQRACMWMGGWAGGRAGGRAGR
jgi:hypothetical protein